jgi:hypothetical protein
VNKGVDGFHPTSAEPTMALAAGKYCLLYSEVQSRISGDNQGEACYNVEFLSGM